MVSDPIADLLTRIRNGAKAQHRFVDVTWSKMKGRLAEILKEEGYIEGFLTKDEGPAKQMRIFLKYGRGRQAIV
ncbi:MAG: 30S ribosomal protein S8, partial [Chlamydiia bacterium]|nr:30S ribosomal protein S8 [Chlamydiia bacterium]